MKHLYRTIAIALVAAFAGFSANEAVEHLRTPQYNPAKIYKFSSGLDRPIYSDGIKLRGKLGRTLIRKDGRVFYFSPLPNLIVNAGENYLVDAFQNLTEPENLKFHGIGTGATAAAETDTGCQTELTTQYNPDNTRATGSLTEGAASNIFRTVGTNTVDAAVAATEWCLMSQAATGGGTMWSRVVFSVINLANGDSLQTTYDLTVE